MTGGRATEGYTATLPGARRELLPMYSLMVATAPKPEATCDEIGLQERETFSDERHLRIYGQRTADHRIATGGRGAPYRFGSRIRPELDNDPQVHATPRQVLVELFPQIDGVDLTHAWGGNLGIRRDWLSRRSPRSHGAAQRQAVDAGCLLLEAPRPLSRAAMHPSTTLGAFTMRPPLTRTQSLVTSGTPPEWTLAP